MKDIGYNYTSEQCRLKIKALKERHQRISKKRGKSGEGGVEDVLEDKMSETFSTPDCKPVYISESGKDNADANTSGDEKLPGPSHQSAKRVKKCDKSHIFPETTGASRWLGGVHHCVTECNCREGLPNLVFKRQTGCFLKSHWSFTKVAYLMIFPETTPRHIVMVPEKIISEFKFHPHCKNGC